MYIYSVVKDGRNGGNIHTSPRRRSKGRYCERIAAPTGPARQQEDDEEERRRLAETEPPHSPVSYLSFVRRSFFRVPRSGSGDLICCEQIVRTTHLSIVLPAATSTVTRGKGRGAGGRAGIRHEDTRLLCTAAPWAKNEALSNFNIDRSRAGRWPDASSASHLVLLREPSILPAWRPGLAPP